MAQQISEGVGTSGAMAGKSSSAGGTPGGGVTPTAKPMDPSAFGWKMLDYKFGDRPLYQVLKNKATTGSFCGKQDATKGAAAKTGMNSPAAAAASRAAMSDAAAGADMTGAAGDSALGAGEGMDFSSFA